MDDSDSFSRTLRWVQNLDPHDFDMADETRVDGFVEGWNTPYSPTAEQMDPATDDLETPYSPAYQSHFRNSAGVDGFVEGYNTPYAPIAESPDDIATHGQMDPAPDDLDTPYSPVDETAEHGGGWTWNDFNDIVPAYMYGRVAAALDTSTPLSPLVESHVGSRGRIQGHHTDHVNTPFAMRAYGHTPAALNTPRALDSPRSPLVESHIASRGRTLPHPTNHVNSRSHAYGLDPAPVNAIIERQDTPYSPKYPLLNSNSATRGQRDALVHGSNTPYSPIAESPESGAHSSNPIIIDDTMSDMEAHGQTDTAFDGMNTPYAPRTDSTDITFGRDPPIFSRTNFHMAAPGQKSASVDEMVTPFSPQVDYGSQYGYNPRLHNGSPVYTRKLDSPLPEGPSTSGSGTQRDPFVIDDETADRVVGEALRLHRARNGQAMECSDDIVPTYMGSPTPRLSPNAFASDTVPDDVHPSFQTRGNLAQELRDLNDTDYSSPSRPVRMSSGNATVRQATSNISNTAAPSIRQPRRSPFDMPQNIRDLYDFAFEVPALGPSAAPKRSSNIISQRAPSYVNDMVAEEIRQPRQYLFVELPQEIEDMIFDFAFPGSDEYVAIKSEVEWEPSLFDRRRRRVAKPYPGHKVNDFLGVSKQFYRASSQAYLRNQGFHLESFSLPISRSILNRARGNYQPKSLPLLRGCTKVAVAYASTLSDYSLHYQALKRVEYQARGWDVGREHICAAILNDDDLKKLQPYKDLQTIRGLVEFRIVPEPLYQIDESDEADNAVWLANMANLEALLKPLVTRPKPKLDSVPPIEQDPDQDDLEPILSRTTPPPRMFKVHDPDQGLINKIKSKLGPVDEEDQFYEGNMYGSDGDIIRSFVKDPSGFIAWAREMKGMKDELN